MIEALWLTGAFAGGFILGLLYFLGLWVTVRRLPHAAHPALLMFASLIGRMAVVLAGFYAISAGGWPALTVAVAGFIAGRVVVVHSKQPHRDLAESAED